jgi:hypothetical protein
MSGWPGIDGSEPMARWHAADDELVAAIGELT